MAVPRTALVDIEAAMAIFGSARVRSKVELPPAQPVFPLEMLIQGEHM